MTDGVKVVVGGGCDYYPGSASSSPSFTFAVTELRVAGEGDLLLELERLRRRLHADGLFEPQKRLPRPPLPRTIGVVTGERGKARDDVLAGLERRGWAGRLVWAFAPVQDRLAAPRIATALRDLAAIPEVDVVIVARGGGSLADLFAFCDEALCRTVALLRVPVIASVGHHTDRTLIDDVAAVSCSTPTHAAEAAVPVDCRAAHAHLGRSARRLHAHGRRAITDRARTLERLAAAPGHHVARERRRLHQLLRELRASARRGVATGRERAAAHVTALTRATDRARTSDRAAPRARSRAPRARPRRARPGPDARPRLRAGRGHARRAVDLGRRGPRRARDPSPLPRRRGRRRGLAMSTPGTAPTYESAVARIEEIIRRLDSGEAGLRETLALVKEGRELVEFCAGELDAVSRGLEELRLDDLVERLEGAGTQP